MTIEMMSKEYGDIACNGKHYVLVQTAYIDGPVEAPVYRACAICSGDEQDEDGLYPVYDIEWEPTEEWLAGDMDDEGDACDWDDPSEITKTGAGYLLAENRVI